MIYNIYFSIAGLINLLLLFSILSVQYKNNTNTIKQAKRIIAVLFITDLLDIITAVTISFYYVVPVWANYTLNIVFYIFEVLCAAMLPAYINYTLGIDNKKMTKTRIVNLVLCGAYVILCITTPITKALFYFENQKFHVGSLHVIEMIVPTYILLYSFIKLIIKRKTFTKTQLVSMIMFIGICILGTILQATIISTTLVSYFADSIAAFFLVVALETPDYEKLSMALGELKENEDLLEVARLRDEEMTRTIHKMTKSSSWNLLYDMNGNMQGGDWSDEFFWMLGYDREELGDKKYDLWAESLHPDEKEKVMAAFFKGVSGAEPYNVRYRLKGKNGEYRWYRGTGDIKPDVTGKGMMYHGIIQDITDEVEREELTKAKDAAMEELEKSQVALKEALVKAESADRAKSDFLANMSHEIRTPINAVLGMNELIMRESTEDTVQEYAANVADAGHALLSLINDILDFSKIEAGRMELAPAEYEVSGLIRELNNMISVRCKDRNLEFKIKNNPDIPKTLYGDEVRIRQILINFLTNAVKYTDKGFVLLDVDFERTSDKGIDLVVAVKDSGIGIKPEDLPALFENFKRVDLEHNRKREGTGLGLSITKSFVQMMGGSIDVASVYGEGSTFTVRIPQTIVLDEPMGIFEPGALHRRKKYEASFEAPEGRILVVDDIATNLMVMKGLLKQTKVCVDTALSGKDCLKAVAENKYDMVFLDHMMPGMTGVETMELISKDRSHPNQDTPVIMLTANAIIGVREEYIGMGFTDYLSKPIQAAELEEMLKKYLPKEKVHMK